MANGKWQISNVKDQAQSSRVAQAFTTDVVVRPASVDRYFEVSLLLMLATSFFTLASTGKLDLVSVVAVALALIAKLWSDARDRNWNLQPRTVTRVSVLYIGFYLLDFTVFSAGPSPMDRLLQATVHLVLFTLVIKVFSARTYRGYGYLAVLSFLLMLASAILTIGTAYLIGFSLYLLFAISTFISYEIKRSSEISRSKSPGGRSTDGGPSALRPGGYHASSTRSRSSIENSLIGTAFGLAVGIAILAVLLFFLIPRYHSGYLNALGTEQQNITGFSESVDLGDIGKILRSNTVVMRIAVDGDPRRFQGVKWRGVGLTGFDGRHWYQDNTAEVPVEQVAYQHFLVPWPEDSPGERQTGFRKTLRYRVLLSPLTTDVIFAAAIPRELSARLRLIAFDETGSLHNVQHGSAPLSYEVVSEAGLPSASELRRAANDYPLNIRLTYLSLPSLDARIGVLARQVTAGAADNYDRALAVQSYLRNNFGYTLNPPGIDPANPIASFLFKSKQGYCEYFAGAMAVMLRALGIPSRLVNGFQTGSYNPVGKDFVVRERDAHSWVEAYFPGYGWVPFDPTPPDPNASADLGRLSDYLDAISLFWNEWVINYDFGHQMRLAREIQNHSQQLHETIQQRLARFKGQGVRSARCFEAWLVSHKLAVLVIVLGLYGLLTLLENMGSLAELGLAWSWKLARKDASLSPRAATFVYQQFLKAASKKGFQKPPSQTPREFALSLSAPGPRTDLARNAAEFTRLYNALRFGEGPVSFGELRQLLDEMSRGL